MKNPPFEITQAILTDAAEISGRVGRLSAGKLSGKNAQNAALRRQFVLEQLARRALLRNAEVCDGLGVSPATANRLLRELCGDGTLERVRDGKLWAYKLREE